MREREINTARHFGFLDRMEQLEGKLLEIDHVVSVDFDIDGFWSNIRQVIIIPQYDIPVRLPDYYAVRRRMLTEIIDMARSFGLIPSGDSIEDYGEHFYIVRDCDGSWVIK